MQKAEDHGSMFYILMSSCVLYSALVTGLQNYNTNTLELHHMRYC